MPWKNNKRSKGELKISQKEENVTEKNEKILKNPDDWHEDLRDRQRTRHSCEDTVPIPDFFEEKLEKLKKENTVAEDLTRKLGLRREMEIYDDGDQSPLKKGEEGHIMEIWSKGFNYNPANPDNSHLSDWLKVVWRGDYSAMMGYVTKARKEPGGLERLLERRETGLNISAIFYVICGARVLFGDNPLFQVDKLVMSQSGLEIKYEHSKILRKLIDLGAKISARDVIGYTPLHHCLTAFGNKQTFEMAKILLKAGADPNLQNRLGTSLLFECVISSEYDSIELLLKYGADPNVQGHETKEGKGESCLEFAIKYNSKVLLRIFAKAERTAKRKAAGGSFRLCRQCNVDGDDNKRCTGCYLVWYCGLDCQRAGWEEHNKECKEVGDQYRLVGLTGTYWDLRSKKHFVVKVKMPIPIDDDDDVEGESLLVHNKEYGLWGELTRSRGQEEVYDELVSNVKKHGFGGVMGFFYAILIETDLKKKNPDGIINIKLNSKQILPVEKW